MKPTTKQIKLIEFLEQQLNFWINSNDISSPTHIGDIREFSQFLSDDFTQDEIRDIDILTHELYLSILEVKKIEGKMNWHYGQPIVNGSYICCIKGYSSAVDLIWNREEGGWGSWWHGEYDDGLAEWNQFDNDLVVCYIGFDEIPMPEVLCDKCDEERNEHI